MATAVARYPQNLISSRSSWDKHTLKIWGKSMQGFRLWSTHKLFVHRRCTDSAGDDYNPNIFTDISHFIFYYLFENWQ